jgi:SAM-dependent methyltransferase
VSGRRGVPAGERTYLPALSHRALDRVYDPVVRLLGADAIRRHVVGRMAIEPRERVLDVGCGTGSLLLLIGAVRPDARLSGVDPDPDILAIAGEKGRCAGVQMDLNVGFADQLPYPDATFDRVVSTLAFHHMTSDEKRGALMEALRVLRPGGRLHIADIGEPRGRMQRLLTRRWAGDERLSDHLAGRIPDLIAAAGFVDVREGERTPGLLGMVRLHEARKPAGDDGSQRHRR